MRRSTRSIAYACLLSATLFGCDKSANSETPAAEAAPAAVPAAFTTDTERAGYALGVSVGRQFKQQGLEVDGAALVRGVQDAFGGGTLALTDEQIGTAMQQLQEVMQKKAQAEQETAQAAQKEIGTKNRAEADAFLAQNKAAKGVTTTDSGLQYTVETMGKGPKPQATDTVKVHYRGTLRDGSVFDSSYDRGEPVTFPVGQVIPGWVEALQLMPVGSKWHLFIPPDLAYGPGGAGGKIGPNAMLEFDVELLAIEPPGTSAAGE